MRTATRKYGNKFVERDGYRFDSQAEARRYAELVILQRAGNIEGLQVHPTYELQPAFVDFHGKRQRAITYTADFAYWQTNPEMSVVEDVKGVITEVFKLKAKMFMLRYGLLDLRVVKG